MEGIHDIFPPDDNDDNDPLLEKKLLKRDGQYDVLKTLLGFDFDGIGKALWLEAAKWEKLSQLFVRGTGKHCAGMEAKHSSSSK